MSLNGKKVMLLGGNYFQMTATKAAKELGCHVISVDYLPDNPGHKYADEYYNVSTTDKEAVLELAKKLKIDGIVSYASDVSAPTAAYVAEKMGLPTNPYRSVEILTHKNLFREFMQDNSLPVPSGCMFADKETAKRYIEQASLPVIIKPIDSSGSKGVKKLIDRERFENAYDEAMHYSISKKIFVEEFIEKKGYQIDGDGFIRDGRIEFFGVMDQHNNTVRNPYAPIGLSIPSIQDSLYQKKAYDIIQNIFTKLDMRFGAFNFEYIIGKNDDIYLLEIGPRNGGNYIPDVIKYALGVDMINASIMACVGEDYTNMLTVKQNRVASSYVIHSMNDGKFKELNICDEIKRFIVKQEIFVKKGEKVHAFRNGGDSIGIMIFSFDNVQQMNELMDKMWEYVDVIVE